MAIFLTGATGHLGSAIVPELIANGSPSSLIPVPQIRWPR